MYRQKGGTRLFNKTGRVNYMYVFPKLEHEEQGFPPVKHATISIINPLKPKGAPALQFYECFLNYT